MTNVLGPWGWSVPQHSLERMTVDTARRQGHYCTDSQQPYMQRPTTVPSFEAYPTQVLLPKASDGPIMLWRSCIFHAGLVRNEMPTIGKA